MRKKLEFQADQIEAVLASHDISARVTGGTVTPRWIRFQVLPDVGAKVSNIRDLHEEIAIALDTPNCRVSRRGAAVAIEIPRDDPQPVRLLPLYNQLCQSKDIPPVTAILGLAEDGAPLLIRLPSPDVGHISIAGKSGAGKTMLLKSIILSLAMGNKPDDLAFIFVGDGLPEVAQAAKQMGFTSCRAEDMGHSAVRAAFKTTNKRVIVVGDDVVRGGEGSTSIILRGLKQLLETRQRHYIMAWDGVPPDGVADLFNVRLVGCVTSAEEARTASGWSGTGAERLLGRGDFVAVAEGRVTRFQAAHVSTEEIQETVRKITPVSQLMETMQ